MQKKAAERFKCFQNGNSSARRPRRGGLNNAPWPPGAGLKSAPNEPKEKRTASTGARTPFAFRVANVYFLIDKCERLAYKARRFPAGLPTVPKQRGFFFLLVSSPTEHPRAPLGRGQRLEARNRRAVFACDRLDSEALAAGLIGPRHGASFVVLYARSHSVSFEAEHDKVTQSSSIGKLRRIGRRRGLNFWVYFFSHFFLTLSMR